ncbi:class I SAM-dependent methyltransferase [Blastomonas sp. SL216]|jgi:phospholipid N-methyltransferase|uniref:class I SAM-dependent methyltransferase n=1 Tax=Blastomonas sp. SL216 TaxID=2995169 RepID=UPI0023775A5B|nr:methyltransferase domain-containing protein [Blastomonas sp. SL216]
MQSNDLAQLPLRQRIKARAERTFGAWGVFFREFVKHPRMVGSVVPSSDRTIRKMLAPVDWPNVKLFVEYGPGVGTFCRAVLDHLPRGATYIAIDTNPDFIRYLRKTIPDSRFIAVHGSAADVESIIAAHGFDHADYVLSGLPLSTLPDGIADQIATATYRALTPGGAFLVYQFTSFTDQLIRPYFDKVERGFEAWNVPPCFLFWGWKARDDGSLTRGHH